MQIKPKQIESIENKDLIIINFCWSVKQQRVHFLILDRGRPQRHFNNILGQPR